MSLFRTLYAGPITAAMLAFVGIALPLSPFCPSRQVCAQDQQDDGAADDGAADGGADGGNGNDGGDTVVLGNIPGAGVVINAEGVLTMKMIRGDGVLDRRRRLEARARLDAELARPSKLRKISLNRLEAALAQRLAAGQGVPDDMRYLAGMTRLKYVFFYPETKDVVIAGPAEGFMLDELGRPVGIASGHAVMQLEDMVVALRTYGPDGQKVGTVGVSIDPTQDGLARMQDFLRQYGGHALPGDTRNIVEGLKSSLGLQTVTITGVPASTHFASVLVEADYRMKLIGIGLERPPVNIASYVQRASPSAVSRNALQRWYFVPEYECVRASDDGFAVELVGDSVRLVGADELVREDGTRVQSGRVDRASRIFVESFTRKYSELAHRAPVYAQLRNLIDMLIAAAYIQDQDFYAQADWGMEILGNEQAFSVELYAVPKQVATAVNAIWKGRTLMTPVGGGVHITPLKSISLDQLLPDEEGDVAEQHNQIDLSGLADGQWWWD